MSELEQLIRDLREFVAERDWQQFHDPKNLAMLLASETGELVAEYRWTANTEADRLSQDPASRNRIAAEIGDIGIGLLLLCDRTGIDFVSAMRDKLQVNRRRYPPDESRGKPSREK